MSTEDLASNLDVLMKAIEQLFTGASAATIGAAEEIVQSIANSSDTSRALQILFQTIWPFLLPEAAAAAPDAVEHQNLCLLIYKVFEKFRNLLATLEWQPFIEYLVWMIKGSSNLTSVLWAVLAIEQASNASLDYDLFQKALQEMSEKQQGFVDYFHNLKQEEIYEKSTFDPLKYQIGFICSQIGNVWHAPPTSYFPHDPPPGVAICPPCLPEPTAEPAPVKTHWYPIVRNDHWRLPTVRCDRSVAFRSKRIYYEAVIISEVAKDPGVQIGWATTEASFSETAGVGDDRAGVALSSSGALHHAGRKEVTGGVAKLKQGDVIGCLIDFGAKKFEFSINGVQVNLDNQDICFSGQPYYATASIGRHQHLWFNFGQVDFLYAPKNITKIQSHGEESSAEYRLSEPETLAEDLKQYYFKDCCIWDAPVEPMFSDPLQDDLDRILIDFEVQDFNQSLKKQFQDRLTALLANEPHAVLRLIESIITELGFASENDETTARHLGTVLPLLSQYFHSNPPPIAKILELLFPYSQERTSERPDYPNIGAILYTLGPQLTSGQRVAILSDQLVQVLEDLLSHGGRQIDQLYAALAIEFFAGEAENREKFTKLRRMVNQLKHYARWSQKMTSQALTRSRFNRMRYQIGFVAGQALALLTEEEDEPEERKQTKGLYPETISGGLKVSPDGRSARGYQNLGSISGNFRFKDDYFEAIILNGSPQIGLRCASIPEATLLFNPASRQVISTLPKLNRQIDLELKAEILSPGDLISCRLVQNEIQFYLNGIEVKLPEKLVLPEEEVFLVTVVLAKDDHVYVNFDQKEAWLYKPKNVL